MRRNNTLYLVCYEQAVNLSICKRLQLLAIDLVIIYTDGITRDDVTLQADYTYYRLRRGFGISEFELSTFAAHREIWRRIVESSGAGLIIDQYVEFDEIISLIREFEINDLSTDLHFLYDGTSLTQDQLYFGVTRLYQWGPPYYWITPQGAAKALGISKARQPLDEEILTLTTSGLEVSYSESRNIKFLQNSRLVYHRLEQTRSAIFQSDAWTESSLVLVKRNLKIISDLSSSIECTPMIFFGTLLGFVRHQNLMPWDDDIDLALEDYKIDRFLSTIEQDGRLRYGLFMYPRGNFRYYKIWSVDGEDIPGFDHKFPFIDLWIYRVENGNAIFCDQLSEFSIDDMHPASKAEFLSASIMVPCNPLAILDKRYVNWRNQIQVFHWSHRTEAPGFFPLTLNISTNQYGLMQ